MGGSICSTHFLLFPHNRAREQQTKDSGKISTEDFSDETLAIDDTCGDDVKEIVVLVDKVADEVTDSEVDKVADMKIPIEDLTEVILEIGD